MKKAKIFKLMLAAFMTAVIAFAVLAVVACEGEHEHSYGEWTTITEASCAQKGLKRRVCSQCDESTEGHVEEESIRALTHIYGKWKVAQAPTCTQPGEEKRVCSRCDESTEGHEQTSRINPTGHNWTQKEVTVQPKFNSVGERIMSCHCESTKTEELDKTGVPEVFRGTWAAEDCRDITITIFSVKIDGLQIISWDGEGDVITVILDNNGEESVATLTISSDGNTLVVENDGNTFDYTKPVAWYNITVSLADSSLGTYTLSGQGPYYAGEEVVLTVTPIEGYEVSNVTIGGYGITPEPDGTYVIKVEDSDLMVIVQFRQITSGGGDSDQAPTYAIGDYVGYWTNYYSRIDYDGHSLEAESYLDISISGEGLRVVLWDGEEKEYYFEQSGNVFVDSVNDYEMHIEVVFNNQPNLVFVDRQKGDSGDLYERSSGLDIPDDYYGYWAGLAADVYYRICITKTDIYMYSATDFTVTPIMIGVTVNQGAEGGYTFTWQGVTYIVTLSDGEMTLIVNGQTQVSLARGQL